MHILIDSTADRALDPTGLLDYCIAAVFVAFLVFTIVVDAFVVMNTIRRNADVVVLGWVCLLMVSCGAALDATSEFVTNGHLEVLDPLRTFSCYTWDYWAKMIGFAMSYAGLCWCMVRTGALLVDKLQRILSTRDQNPDTAAVADQRYTPDTMEMENVTLIDAQPSEPSQTKPRNYLEACMSAICCVVCTPITTLHIVVTRGCCARIGVAGRVKTIGAGTSLTIMCTAVLLSGLAYVPGVVYVSEADVCYTRTWFKLIVTATTAAWLVGGWVVFIFSTYPHPWNSFQAWAFAKWKSAIEPVLLWCLEFSLLMLTRGVPILSNCMVRAIVRTAVPRYLTASGEFLTSPVLFVRVTRYYVVDIIKHAGAVIMCRTYSRVDEYGMDNEVFVAVDPDSLRATQRAATPYFALQKPSLCRFVPVADELIEHATASDARNHVPSITTANFGLALKAFTVSIVFRMVFNMLYLDSYYLFRNVNMLVVIAAYTTALLALIGVIIVNRLKRVTYTDNVINSIDNAIQYSLQVAISYDNHRAVAEFLEFVHSFVRTREQTSGSTMVYGFRWRRIADSPDAISIICEYPSEYVGTSLIDLQALPLGPNNYDCYVYGPELAAFIDQYLVCKTLVDKLAEQHCTDSIDAEYADGYRNVYEHLCVVLSESTDRICVDILTIVRAEQHNLLETLRTHKNRFAVPVNDSRKRVLMNTLDNEFNYTMVVAEYDIAVALINELFWSTYTNSGNTLGWLRLAKTYTEASDKYPRKPSWLSGLMKSRPHHRADQSMLEEDMDEFT